MGKFIEKLWDWIVWSSANPNQLSLSAKGFLTGAVTLLTFGAGLQNVHLPTELLTMSVDATVVAIQSIIGTVSAIALVVGLIRKVVLTAKGENLAIRD